MTDETNANRAAHEPDLNLLAASCDGKLGPAESAKLLDHLAGCRSCRETAALMARALAAEPVRSPVVSAAAGWLALAATLLLASIVGIRISREQPSPAPAPEPAPLSTAPAAAPAAPPEATAAPVARPAAEPPDVKRGGKRKVASKTFHLVAGEWVDAAYDATAGLPLVEAAGTEARRKLLEEHPELQPYLGLGDRILVVLGGTAYRIGPVSP